MKSKKPRHENPAVPRRSCPVSRGTRLPSRRRRRHTSPPDVRGAPVRISTRARAMGPRDMTSLGGPRVDETAATADDGVFRGARVKARAAALDLLADAATLVTPLRGRPGGGASGDLDAATGGDVTASSWPSPSPARARARRRRRRRFASPRATRARGRFLGRARRRRLPPLALPLPRTPRLPRSSTPSSGAIARPRRFHRKDARARVSKRRGTSRTRKGRNTSRGSARDGRTPRAASCPTASCPRCAREPRTRRRR